jgi:hypothetical protein
MFEDKNDFLSRLGSPVVVACHDAGAANLIFAWLSDWADSGLLGAHVFRLLLKGPAEVAWKAQSIRLPHFELHNDMDTALTGALCVLTGTGWSSNIEHDARKLAATMHIHSIAVVDHWVNYPDRFERGSEVILPNEIWVSDGYASEIAGRVFKGLRVVELPNTYLEAQVKRIHDVPEDSRTLLCVLEPLRVDWGPGESSDFKALDFFAMNLHLIVGNQPVDILLRPHPSDPPHKYEDWIKRHPRLSIKIDLSPSLSEAIGQARWVVGAETFAMVVALAAGRQTYSLLPPWSHRCRLPHKEILHLVDLS